MTATDTEAAALYLGDADLAQLAPLADIPDAERTGHRYDPRSVLMYGDDQRVPSRMGAVEWARDVVNWSRATSAVALAMAIALRLDETLVCWPRQEVLAADICASGRTVRNAMDELESHRVGVRLWLWREDECSGCVYTLNVDGWLDDIITERDAVLRRVVDVRTRGFALGLNIRQLPKGTELSARQPENGR